MKSESNRATGRSTQSRVKAKPGPLGAVAKAAVRLGSKARVRVDAAGFVKQYYELLAPDDLDGDRESLAAAALDHLDWASRRTPGTAGIRVFNPRHDANGFSSSHTHVEIINDDMPFLVESTTHTLNRLGHSIVLTIHPRFKVKRDARGTLKEVYSQVPPADARTESFIHVELARITDASMLRNIEVELATTLADVRAAVEDWSAMLAQLNDASEQLRTAKGPSDELRQESSDFLDWLARDHFVLLGYHEFKLVRGSDADRLAPVSGTGLGILRDSRAPQETTTLRGAARTAARSTLPLIVTKANQHSRIHRSAKLDYISAKVFDARGRPVTERRFLGLFTSSAYNERPGDIPLLRRKTRKLIERAGVDPASHRGRRLQHIIDSFPRDELFQAPLAELARTTNGILGLQERRRLRLFCRRDAFGRFYSCLVYLPRDQYTSRARANIEQVLLGGLEGQSVESEIRVSDATLARLAVTVGIPASAQNRPVDIDALERELAAVTQTWSDKLRSTLLARFPEERALALFHRFADKLSVAYQEDMSAERGADDVLVLEALADGIDISTLRMSQLQSGTPRLRVSVYSTQAPIALHHALRLLENMGLRVLGERAYTVQTGTTTVFIQDFETETASGIGVDAITIEARFKDCLARALDGSIDDDGFNSFVVTAGLDWREANVLRAYCHYLLQTGMRFSQQYIQEVLGRYPLLCRALIDRFESLFDPGLSKVVRERCAAQHDATLQSELNRTVSLDEDRILRAFTTAVEATLRTNFFQQLDGEPKPWLAFKLDPCQLPDLPKPRPQFEIFVYSERMEAVHLRCAKVARGGIRWSDRREDFRTEVLGLMKAQQVKNAVIVPMGAKGGFVCKRLPTGDRAAVRNEVIECYKAFMRGLLDVTDNIVAGKVVHPANVVSRDDDDPYLVVAADKGTASFSDIANALADEYDYWLGDAFASGGSAGYDHKKMGITARGAWVSVERHFREFSVDVASHDFTAVGIGDMSGDVFGNGLIYTPHTRLVAAFNHLHIFIDPEPDPATSFAERKRLFDLPASSWDDYDRAHLSPGGGIYSRAAKSITLHPKACAALGLDHSKVTPPELVRAILKAPVDLLWNGGIGTYVKASHEGHTDAGDPANDDVRVDGRDLRCRVVGEGGNLGFTQRGRIEYAQRGGAINTDFIDNSAGVDTSDHEVNIKILLRSALDAGALKAARRTALLTSMRDEIAARVLADNYGQTQVLSMISSRSAERLGEQTRLISILEARGALDRTLDALPGDDELEEHRRSGIGLTRPELCLVLSHAKNELTQELISTDIPDDPVCARELERYFPPRLRRFSALMATHPLHREIMAMMISGSMINRMGPYFPFRTQEETGADIGQVARAYSIAREILGVRKLWRQIEDLDGKIPAAVQYDVSFQLSRIVRHAVYWFLQRHPGRLEIGPVTERFRDGVATTLRAVPAIQSGQPGGFANTVKAFEAAGLPKTVARHLGALNSATQILDIVEIAAEASVKPADLARLYFKVGRHLHLDWIHDQIEALQVEGHWRAMARATLRETLAREHRTVVTGIVRRGSTSDMEAAFATWLQALGPRVERIERIFDEMQSAGPMDFATLSIALKEVARLA